MSFVAAEIESQPDSWLRAAKLAHTPEVANALPPPDARVAIVGCGNVAKDLHLPAYVAWNVDVAEM